MTLDIPSGEIVSQAVCALLAGEGLYEITEATFVAAEPHADE